MYHPAAALRTPALERESYEDIALVPDVLIRARERQAPAGVPVTADAETDGEPPQRRRAARCRADPAAARSSTPTRPRGRRSGAPGRRDDAVPADAVLTPARTTDPR